MNLHFVGYLIGMSDSEELSKKDELIANQYDLLYRLKKGAIGFNNAQADQRTKHHHYIRLHRIDELRVEFIESHKQIIQFDKSSEYDYVKKDCFDDFETRYLDTVAHIKESFDKLYPSLVPPEQALLNSTLNGTPNITYQIMQPAESAYKLPMLNLQQFDGDYTEWLSFYDSFLQIHCNEKLTAHHKFQYLKGALSPSVKSVIKLPLFPYF